MFFNGGQTFRRKTSKTCFLEPTKARIEFSKDRAPERLHISADQYLVKNKNNYPSEFAKADTLVMMSEIERRKLHDLIKIAIFSLKKKAT